MRFFNWAESFKEQPTCEDILKKIQKIEIIYWISLLLAVFISVLGLLIMLLTPANNLKALFLGLFLGTNGLIQIAMVEIWVHIKLSMYRIIWDQENRLEAEINKLEAADL